MEAFSPPLLQISPACFQRAVTFKEWAQGLPVASRMAVMTISSCFPLPLPLKTTGSCNESPKRFFWSILIIFEWSWLIRSKVVCYYYVLWLYEPWIWENVWDYDSKHVFRASCFQVMVMTLFRAPRMGDNHIHSFKSIVRVRVRLKLTSHYQ